MGCEEKLELVSRYIDDELLPGERVAFEEHLKHCEECRRALGEMRGTDAVVGRAVRAHRVGGAFVRRVMGRLSRPRGRWLALGGAFAAVALCAGLWWVFRAPADRERAGTVLRAPEGSFVAGRAAFDGMELPAGAEAKATEAGLVLKLGQATLYLGGSTELRVDSSAHAALLSGEVFVQASGAFRLRVRPALDAKTEHARFLVDAEGVTVVAGKVDVPFAGVDVEVPHGKRMLLGVGEFRMDGVDLRAIRPAYVPDELLGSPWPVEGGDERRSGFSPFPLVMLPPREFKVLPASGRVSAPVVTWGKKVAATAGRMVFLDDCLPWPLPGERLGSPCAFERSLVVSVAEKGVAISCRGATERVIACDAAAGCLVSWGAVFVPVKDGLAAFRLDGGLLWAQPRAATEFPVSKWRGIVFAACRDGYLRALDAATGDVVASSIVRPAGFGGYPVVTPDGRCYAVSGSQLVWLEREGKTGVIDLPEGEYPVPPAVHPSGALYLCDGKGVLRKVTEEKAERLFDAGSGATAQPVCDAAGNVLIPAGGELVCVSEEGERLWRADVEERVEGIAVLPDGSIVVTSNPEQARLAPTP